jgi:hypothetical protein
MRIYILPLIFLAACTGTTDNPTENPTSSDISSDIQTISLEEGNSCNYSGTLDLKTAHSFKSDTEAEDALKSIMKHTGLPTNFLLVAADVDNAAAAIYQNKRYILYNQRFMEEVKNKTKTKFGSLSILAHEIGHHLSGHTLLEAEARLNLELEADRFSGFILAKMGATIDEACTAMEIYGSNTASSTHPGKKTRIAAIVNGWKEALEDSQKNTITEVVSPSTIQGLYIIDVPKKAEYITIRNRSLSPEEYKLGNSGTQEGNILNKETVIMNLPNGTEVEVLSSINKTYYVRAKTSKGEVLGYIIKSYAGQPTIKQRAKH